MMRFGSMVSAPGSWALILAIGSFGSPAGATQVDEEVPLSRVREGGTPYDPNAPIQPYAIFAPLADEPTTGLVASPPEYDPTKGVIFRYSTAAWPTVVRACVKALTANPNTDEIAYVVVASQAVANAAATTFASDGADLSKVVFIIQPTDSIWMRDYGPHFIYQDGSIAIADSHYYPNRQFDNFSPTLLAADNFKMASYDMPLYYSGGNFQPGPNRSGFVTALVNLDNPAAGGWTPALIAEYYQRFQGIDTLHVLGQLPFSVDGTGHIDMWMYLIDENRVVISEFIPGSNATAIAVTNAAVTYMQNLGFQVFRPKAWNSGGVHYTYANAFRVNNRIFVPVYGTAVVAGGSAAWNAYDADAMAVWQAAVGPNIEVIPIQCGPIISAAGAIHCIVKQVPRYADSMPSAVVISPAGDEVWISGTTETIRWNATAFNNAPLTGIDLEYSLDGGQNWSVIAANLPDTGSYQWTVPASSSQNAMIKVVANAPSDLSVAAMSNSFRMGPGTASVYDFSTGAGSTRFGFGFQTASWAASVSAKIAPVVGALTGANYLALATSNATGALTDPNRYITPTMTAGNEATHLFTFQISEAPAAIDEIKVLWEGFAERCTQAELYIWDYAQNQWGNGKGMIGQNRFADTWAGNRDGFLDAAIRENITNYLGGTNTLRVLIYAQRPQDRTVHDYISVTVKQLASCPNDLTGDGVVDGSDLGSLLGQWGACAGCAADFNGDGIVNGNDLGALLGAWGSCN